MRSVRHVELRSSHQPPSCCSSYLSIWSWAFPIMPSYLVVAPYGLGGQEGRPRLPTLWVTTHNTINNTLRQHGRATRLDLRCEWQIAVQQRSNRDWVLGQCPLLPVVQSPRHHVLETWIRRRLCCCWMWWISSEGRYSNSRYFVCLLI